MVGHGLRQEVIAQAFQQQKCQMFQDSGGFIEQIAPGEQLHKHVGYLEDEVEAKHHIEIVAVAEGECSANCVNGRFIIEETVPHIG